jgi:hypothetical protein
MTTTAPAPFRIGRNGTGTISAPRRTKYGVTVLLTATGKAGQPLWSERRLVTVEQAAALLGGAR